MNYQEKFEQGVEQGIEQGITVGQAQIIQNMHRKGYTPEQIADIVEKSVEEVETIIAKKEPLLV